jgi:hypothetical protein
VTFAAVSGLGLARFEASWGEWSFLRPEYLGQSDLPDFSENGLAGFFGNLRNLLRGSALTGIYL